VRQYYSGCSLIDSQVCEILGLLEERGLASSTWIIFGSDHGELLGDYGLIQKRLFYPGSVQVPLIVVPPAGRDTRDAPSMSCDFLVQNVDLSATILDIAGVRPFFRDGRSLLEQMSNAKARRRVAVSEIADFTMVFDGIHKLIYETATRDPQSLVNVRSDPEEIVDLLSSGEGRSTADMLLRLEEAERAREMEGAT
jgi:choline-sulfatase